ncbi:hypothetical protein BGX23_009015 [Mortierella sp. AD031]|nr:hypothetical protein BGX23_009015 [Mortierella sp. AD031]
MDSVQPTSLPTTTIIIPANAVSVVVKPHKMWQIPEMLELIGLCLPLFDRRFETGRHRFVDIWDPKPLLRVGLVNKRWHKIMRGILWKTYDFAIMGRKVPMDVLKKNIGLVRNLSLMDKAHKKNAAL